MTSSEVKAALMARYCAPEWALFFEVADATGSKQNRWADAVAMNLYPSRGMELNGFEIKVSRSDWTRELKNPEKSAPVQQYCDRWWIVAPPGVIIDGELPPTWGQIEAKEGGKLRQVVAAPKLDAKPVTRDFMGAMLRRASVADDQIVRSAVNRELAALRANDDARYQRSLDRALEEHKALKQRIGDIERSSGIKLDGWTGHEEIARAIKHVIDSGVMGSHNAMIMARDRLAKMVKDIDGAISLFPGLKETENE